MNSAPPLTAEVFRSLQGRTVLVRPARSGENPVTGVRGSLEVGDDPSAGRPCVEIVLRFPEMFQQQTHERRIRLDDEQLAALLASEVNGAYEFVFDGEPGPDPAEPA